MKLNNIFSKFNHRSRDVSTRTLQNVFFESTPDGKSESIIIGTPGHEIFIDESNNPEFYSSSCRGLHYTSTSRLFAMLGGRLTEILENGTSLIRFTMTNIPTSVSMCDDGVTMVFVDGYTLHLYDLVTNVISVPDPLQIDFKNPTKVIYSNGRAVVINNDFTIDEFNTEITRKSNRFYWSALRDLTQWSAINFATAEQSADQIIGMESRDSDIWFLGTRSYEIWRGTDDADLPWIYYGGSSSDIGCMTANSIASNENSIFFLGSSNAGNNHIFMSKGTEVVNISTSDIASFLSDNQGKTSDAYGFVFNQENHQFYVITFIQLDRTFVYDISTGLWHERSSRDPLLNIHHYWRARYAVYAFGRVIVGDSKIAFLSILNMNKFDDDIGGGSKIPIVRILQSGNLSDSENNQEMTIRSLQFDLEMGTGLLGNQFSSDPELMLELSRDGGYSFGNQMVTSIGKLGNYTKRAVFRRLGLARELTIRLTFSNPSRFLLISSFGDIITKSGKL
jgi:hypothetical protein